MNSKYKDKDNKVIVYDELGNKTTRMINSDIEKTLNQENIIEAIEIGIDEEKSNIISCEKYLKEEIRVLKKNLKLFGIISIITISILTIFPYNILVAITAPALAFVGLGFPISLVVFVGEVRNFKYEKRKSLNKIDYYQNRKEVELKKLEEISNEIDNSILYLPKEEEKNLDYKYTMWRISSDAELTTPNISKKLVKIKKNESNKVYIIGKK